MGYPTTNTRGTLVPSALSSLWGKAALSACGLAGRGTLGDGGTQEDLSVFSPGRTACTWGAISRMAMDMGGLGTAEPGHESGGLTR